MTLPTPTIKGLRCEYREGARGRIRWYIIREADAEAGLEEHLYAYSQQSFDDEAEATQALYGFVNAIQAPVEKVRLDGLIQRESLAFDLRAAEAESAERMATIEDRTSVINDLQSSNDDLEARLWLVEQNKQASYEREADYAHRLAAADVEHRNALAVATRDNWPKFIAIAVTFALVGAAVALSLVNKLGTLPFVGA